MQLYDDALRIYYEIKERDGRKYCAITDSDSKLNEIVIPESLDDAPVEAIEKKAFLGCKGLRYVRVPETVVSIGEWAFAFCDNLVRIELPRAKIDFGKGVFKGDDRLQEIGVYDVSAKADQCSGTEDKDAARMVSRLMAAAPVIMDAQYLLDTLHSGDAEWLRKWDTRLSHILNLKDDDGYHLYVLCGEEDLHFDYEEYLEYNREKKSYLCMLRLVNDTALKEEDKEPLKEYLRNHTCGCESQAAVRVLLKHHGDDIDHYRIMLETGAVNDGNLESVLQLMGDRNARMKAFLIEECGKKSSDFFDDLIL